MQNIFFGASPVNSILEHDAECLKYLTSAKVKKTCMMQACLLFVPVYHL